MLESYKWMGWVWDGMGMGWKSLRGVILRAPLCGANNEALSSGEPKPIISNVARGPKARGQHWKLLAEAHHLINSL